MTEPTNRVQVNSVAALTELVPYLLGFDPHESLVALVVDGGRVAVTARADLTDLTEPGNTEDLLAKLTHRWPGMDGMYLLGYSTDATLSDTVLDRCQQHLGHRMLNRIRVDGDTWYADGSSGTINRYGALSAQFTVHGLVRRGSRSEVEAALASPPPKASDARLISDAISTLPAAGDVAATVASTRLLVDWHLAEPAALEPAMATQLAVLVHHPAASDRALLKITADNAAQHAQLWSTVVQRAPADASAVPLGLAGMASWVAGDGVTAAVALKRLEQMGQHRAGLGQVLAAVIDNVVPPTEWGPIRAGLLKRTAPEVREALTATPAWEDVQPTTGRQPQPPTTSEPPRPGPSI